MQQEGSLTHIACVKEVANWEANGNFRTEFSRAGWRGIVSAGFCEPVAISGTVRYLFGGSPRRSASLRWA
ncbi:MAG: hypothetical protein R3F19_25050 [Verrucomicrobiales bacterium]